MWEVSRRADWFCRPADDSNRDERRLMGSDEHSGPVFTEDPTVRSAVWSPSGMSDLGR